MPNFKTDYSNQNMFVPVIIDESLIPGTIEYAISHIVDNHLDLSLFDEHYCNDQNGAAAYQPSIMLRLSFMPILSVCYQAVALKYQQCHFHVSIWRY